MSLPLSRIDELKRKVVAIHNSTKDLDRLFQRVSETVLKQSVSIRDLNFRSIGEEDLSRLFDYYDVFYFSNMLRELVRAHNIHSLTFRLSNRMTRAGGKTFRSEKRIRTPAGLKTQVEYQIAVSTLLLFNNFQNSQRSIKIGGLVCHNRLEALQRIFEHELIHFIEFLLFEDSSCAGPRFQSLAKHIFGHTDWHHNMITSQERARTEFQIRVGDHVEFRYEGKIHQGFINRITKRATILVKDPKGQLMSDGQHYSTYYVPLDQLRKVTNPF